MPRSCNPRGPIGLLLTALSATLAKDASWVAYKLLFAEETCLATATSELERRRPCGNRFEAASTSRPSDAFATLFRTGQRAELAAKASLKSLGLTWGDEGDEGE